MKQTHLIRNDSEHPLYFIKSDQFGKKSTKDLSSITDPLYSNRSIGFNNPLLNLLNETSFFSSFACENDSTLGAGEYSFLIYGGQYLSLYNVDGLLHRRPWNTNISDTIKQIRWSSYHRSYLLMTARSFFQFTLSPFDVLSIAKSFKSNEHLQLFACHQTDIWLVCLASSSKRQSLVQYHFSDWERTDDELKSFSLDQLGLYRTDVICAIENDHHGEYLALLIAQRNQNLTVGIQRRRRLLLASTDSMSTLRTIYFSGADDQYWTLTSIPSKNGWLLSQWADNEITFLDNNCNSHVTTMEYSKKVRHLAVTSDGHYLIIRTVDSLDIYQID